MLKILGILLLVLFWGPAVLAQRAISSREQAARLQSRERVIQSPDCADGAPGISLEVTIDQYGAVTRVKERKARWVSIRLPVTAVKSLLNQAKKMVASWRYMPTLVGGKPIAVKTIVTVPCVAPQK